MCHLDADLVEDRAPVHGAFGLTYASYFVARRALLQAMPVEWQRRFTQVMREFWAEFDSSADDTFDVHLRDERGRYRKDPLANYRHPDRALIESLRTQSVQDEAAD